jgi:hypothetical protein
LVIQLKLTLDDKNKNDFKKPKDLKRKNESLEFNKITLKKFLINFEKIIDENIENRNKYSTEPEKYLFF